MSGTGRSRNHAARHDAPDRATALGLLRSARESLRESEARYRRLFESVTDAILVVTSERVILDCNSAFLRLTGYAREDAVGQCTSMLYAAPEEFARVGRELAALQEPHVVRQGEMRRKDGSTFTVEVTLYPVVADGSAGPGWIGFIRDVSERRHAEEALRRLAAVVESSEDAILSQTLDGTVTSWNAGAERLYGYAAGEILGRSVLTILPPERAEELAPVLLRVARGEAVDHHETVGLRKDGRRVDVSLTVSPLRDAAGRTVGASVIARDITEARTAEHALAASEALLRQVLETLPVGVWIADHRGRLTVGNPAARRIWEGARNVGPEGYAQYKGWWSETGEPMRPDEWALARAITRGETSLDELVDIQCFDGSRKTILNSAAPIRGARGEVLGAIVVNQDVTERRRLEQQFLQSQKMEAVGRLAGGVAHDFNNLLSVILGYGELVLRRLPAGDPAREKVEQMVRAAERGAGLTRQLLSFSHRKVGQATTLDVNRVVGDMDKMLRRLIGEDVELVTTLERGLGCVRADPGQVEQVVVNLAVNARDAMPRGGRLTIETANVELDAEYAESHLGVSPGAYVMLVVSDTGHGMDAATLAHAFEPFFTTKERGKGTGLGLATVYGIVQQAKGYVWVYSEPGMGTRFKIYLPRVDGSAEPHAAARPAVPCVSGRETLMVVEDEPVLRALISEALQAAGFNVLCAKDGDEALGLARAHTGQVDLLLTDVVMPGRSGPDVAARLRELHPALKVVFMSGYTGEVLNQHGALEGAQFLEKPFSPDTLSRRLRDVLDAR